MNFKVKIISKTVICILIKSINILNRIKRIHKNFCLGTKLLSYTHKSIVNIYLMPDITDPKGSDLLKYGLFGAI